MIMKAHVLACCLYLPLALSLPCMAQEAAPSPSSAPADEPAVVRVDGVKGPVMHSYRTISAGLDAFDKHHHLAPAVPQLRFRLQTNRNQKDALAGEPLTLRIVGTSETIVIPFDPDGRVTIPRNQRAYDEKAELVINRKKSQLHGLPDVRTAGLPANVRRLGDLRLECQVMIALAKAELNVVLRTAASAVIGSDWCSNKRVHIMVEGPGPLQDAFISHGNRSATVKISEAFISPPIQDASWPDDALIEMTVKPEAAAQAAQG